jgi:hypothetical protein
MNQSTAMALGHWDSNVERGNGATAMINQSLAMALGQLQ